MAARVGLLLALAMLAMAQVGAAASSATPPTVWKSLHRPLHLPQLRKGAPCPRTKAGRAAPATGYTLGTGPVYVVLGFSYPPPDRRGVVHLKDGKVRWGWHWVKTLWAFSPRYRGPVLIRGRRLDGRWPVKFVVLPHRYAELRVPRRIPRRADGWSYLPSGSGYQATGCYGFQMDGRSFSRVVIFKVVQ
jgi:hypothetical protein